MLYTDPGSGVLIWQLVIAVFFGATFYFTRLRHWATAKLRLARNTKAEPIAKIQTPDSSE